MEKSSWENALRHIFSDIFLDQLHKEFNDVESEVDQVYQYLHDNERPEFLCEVEDFTEFKASLSLPEDEVLSIIHGCGDDIRKSTLQMARLFTTKAYHAAKGARSFEGEGVTTREYQWNENISSKNEESPSRSARLCVNPKQQGFLQNYIPAKFYQETEHFKKLKENIVRDKCKVCHVYGMSGVGKSVMVRHVCSEIDSEHNQYAIWHVQCPQKEKSLKSSLKQFSSRLKNCYPDQSIQDLTDDGRTKHFVESLMQMEFNSLLVLEDSENEEDKDIIRDLVINILNAQRTNLQLILVTQRLDTFYVNGRPSDTSDYKLFPVTGFTEEEALTFLSSGGRHNDKGIKDLACELSYSPFRLYIAREFCKKFEISYESYYNDLGKNEKVILQEKRLLERYPNLGKHTYEVVTKMLEPADKDEKSQQDVVKMMSFLNDVSIPDVLIGKFFRESCPEINDVTTESLYVKMLLKRLEQEFCASVYSIHSKYSIISTVHKDILTAVRFSMSMTERREIIVHVLCAMLSLIGKDNRVRQSNILLSDMRNHLSLVFHYANELLVSNLEITDNSIETLNILIYMSRLSEVVGFATSQLSSSTNDYWFDQATNYFLDIARFSLKDTDHEIGYTNDIKSLLSFAEGKDPRNTAEQLFELLRAASQRIPGDWIFKINNLFSPFTMAYVKDMKQRWPELEWDDIENRIKSMIPLRQQQYESLQQTRAILEPEILHKICLPEYLASILHSRGRQMFYMKKTITKEQREGFEWFTDVGFSLCQIISEKTGVNSIFKYIIKSNNILHRLLVASVNAESDEQFLDRLAKARILAKEMLNVDGDFYEHGKYKLVPGSPFTKMNALNIIVKANTKVHKRSHLAKDFIDEEAMAYCHQLYEVGKQYAPNYSFASNCLINVGRYLGAIGKYGMAMEAIERGFSTNGIGIDSQREIKVENCSWALYNSGRVLYASEGKLENFQNHCDKFFARYKYLKMHKSQEMPGPWHEALDDMKYRLELIYKSEVKTKTIE